MPNAILIATSLAPGDRIGLQKRAVNSWLENGFQVRSYNDAKEAELIRDEFPDVQFQAVDRTAQAYLGKPLVFVSDILSDLGAGENGICGIVNSDIFFRNSPDLAGFLFEHANDSIVLGARLEVENYDDDEGKPDPFGIDYNFMPSGLISKLSESDII